MEDDLTETFNTIFLEIDQQDFDGCFQRLICDIAAKQTLYENDFPVLTGIAIAKEFDLQPKAQSVMKKIMTALRFGKSVKKIKSCEASFHKCNWTGAQMENAVQNFQLLANN